MSAKSILVLGAGGAAANGFCRALYQARGHGGYVLHGTNCDEYGLALAETDFVHHLPHACDPEYRSALLALCELIEPDMVHAQNDEEVCQLSLLRQRLPVFLPTNHAIRLCQNKWFSHACWRGRVPQPDTQIVYFPAELEAMLRKHGRVWLRNIRGAGGNGSIITDSYEFGRLWIDRHKGWGQFTAAEVLSPETATWTGLYHNGDLRADQGRKRLAWGYARNQPSGVSGITGVAETYTDADLTDTAMRAVNCVDDEPHGLYGVDCVRNWDENTWNPTEINIGRFHTTVSEFFAAAGLNLPNLYCRLFFGENVASQKHLRDGIKWIRLMDSHPVML